MISSKVKGDIALFCFSSTCVAARSICVPINSAAWSSYELKVICKGVFSESSEERESWICRYVCKGMTTERDPVEQCGDERARYNLHGFPFMIDTDGLRCRIRW